jgi:hypothetical protein
MHSCNKMLISVTTHLCHIFTACLARGYIPKATNPQKMVIVPCNQKRDLSSLNGPAHSGYTLQPTTDVKYLGHIMDKGLTWKAQPKNVMSKACRASWTCRGIFYKIWGVKPRVMDWIYAMVIRPILTYSSMVWWPRVRYNVSMTQINKLHRLTCLATTDVMKMTQRAAMEVLLGLLLFKWLRPRTSQVSTD